MNKKLILTLLLFSSNLFCCNNFHDDTVYFKGIENLIILTQNVDSIQHYIKFPYPNPFVPDQRIFAARIDTYDTVNAIFIVRDSSENKLGTFSWKKLPAGVYKFLWWEYLYNITTGVYYIERILNGNSENKKVFFEKYPK